MSIAIKVSISPLLPPENRKVTKTEVWNFIETRRQIYSRLNIHIRLQNKFFLTLLPAVNESSSSSTCSPTLGVVSLFHCRHLNRCVLVFCCDLNVYLPNDPWCWAHFHALTCHLDIFGEVSVKRFCWL